MSGNNPANSFRQKLPSRRAPSPNRLAAFLGLLAILLAAASLHAQSPTSPTKEYIRAGGKLIAIEIPGAGAAISVSVTPQSPPALGPSGTQQFAASVAGSSNQTVNWIVASGLGSISQTGLYTAPSTIAATSSAIVRATSQADTSKFDQVTITLNPPPAGPSIAGLSPLNQTAYDVTFSMLAQGGGSPVKAVQIYIDNTLDGVGGCLLWYEQSDNRIYLGGNSDPYTWAGSAVLGSTTVVQNNQCYLYGTGSSRVISGNNTSLSIRVQFKSTWAGLKQVHTWIQNTALAANGWNYAGNWTVGTPPAGVTPATGGTFPNQLLQLTANTNPPGAAVNWSLSAAQGTITAAGLYKAPASIASQQNITATARLASNNSVVGTATITLKPLVGPTQGAPTMIYSHPNSESGFAEVFRFNWRDPQGANTIDEARVRFSNTNATSGGSDAGICSFRWTRANNQFELFNDAGTALLPPIVNGSPNSENSSCTLISEGINSLWWPGGDGEHWEIQVGIGFKAPWASGTKYIQMWARDNTGRETAAWENAGTWGFPSNSTIPAIDSVTPTAASMAPAQSFFITATDASGRADIDSFQFVIGNTPTFPSPNTCHFFYFRGSNYGVLLDDDPTQWAGFSEIVGWGYDLNNSQCTVKLGQGLSSKGDSAVTNGFFVQPRIEIKVPFRGARKIWALVADNAGNNSGYQFYGDYTFNSAGLYELELIPFYKQNAAPGQRELWVKVQARRLGDLPSSPQFATPQSLVSQPEAQ